MLQKIKKKISSDKNFKELLSGSSITFVLKILGMLFSYLVLKLISKDFGAEGVGIYGLSNKILRSIGLICALGFNISVLRYVGEYSSNKDKSSYLQAIFKYFNQLALPISLIVAVFIYTYSDYIATYVFENSDYTTALKIIAFTLPFFTLNLINVEFIRGLKLLKVSEFLRSISIYLVMLIVLFFSLLNSGLLNPIYALALGVFITFLISVIFIYTHLKKLGNKKEKISLKRTSFVKTSMPMMVISISSFVLAFSGVFFLETFSSTKHVGIYNICVMLAQLVSLALTVVNTISAPKFSELYWNNRKKELKKVIRQSSKLIFWSSLFVSIVLLVNSEMVLTYFGEEFLLGQTVLIILIFGQIINATTGSVGVFLNMTGNQKALRNIILTTALFVVVGYYFIIPVYGMVGAALVSVSGTIILNVCSAVYVYSKLKYVTFYIPFLKFRYNE
ncbi:flippase [Xanthomarina sp. F2636L]|uniref:flippase n=1 Tax=Xanthomarina sp. F2636L TaxID=2996018 RepID=UPI00225E4D60|nr:flippase [Xanthomarina sp. F2636L]MCX7551328.1 flippase [Xanthomarina sp. F2636L]